VKQIPEIMKTNLRKIIPLSRTVPKESKHIRWCYEQSDRFYMEHSLANYHFVIVDTRDSFNTQIINSIFDHMLSINSVLEKEPFVCGKVHNSEFRYLLASCHALASKSSLVLDRFSRPVIFDKQLVNKEFLKLEDYVHRLYE
jgi:hypothetical protein